MAKRTTLPYWLAGGPEKCGLCTHPHVLQSLRRCAACDRAACEHCVVINRETGEVLCQECLAEQDQEENG